MNIFFYIFYKLNKLIVDTQRQLLIIGQGVNSQCRPPLALYSNFNVTFLTQPITLEMKTMEILNVLCTSNGSVMLLLRTVDAS